METTSHPAEHSTNLEKRHAILAEALSKRYISIAEVDLCTGQAVVLQSSEDAALVGKEIPWSMLLQRYADRRTYPADRSIVLSLTSDYLETFWEREIEETSLEVRCVSGEESYIWVKISVIALSAAGKKLLITTRSINEDRILQRIVDLYVFQDMDYFVLLDAKHNSSTMLGGKKQGLPIPATHCDDYTAEMIRYNNQYVVPEDLDRVTANLQIPHILETLEKKERYSFSSGGLTDDGEYRRTRIQYQYYDRPMGLILLTRTDITQIFMEEQSKRNQLAAALRDAQHDALTDIYNQKATAELISGALQSRYWNQAAFLFVDVDNFKMVNDTLGHQTGDRLLQFLADSLQKLAGRDGIAGRVGGDEFLLFFSVDSDKEATIRCAERICRVFDSLPDNTVENLPISCSVGISIYPKDGADYETLVRKADQALYTSKRYGKNRYYFYSEEGPLK